MKMLVVLCNVLLFAFTLFVLATHGLPKQGSCIAFTALLLAVPFVTIYVLHSTKASKKLAVARAAAAGNLVLLAAACAAVAAQYPHPNEPGFIPYLAVVLGTPVLSAAVLHVKSRGRAV